MSTNDQSDQMSYAEVKQLSGRQPEEIVKAMREGRLDDLLHNRGVCPTCHRPAMGDPEPPSAA